MDTVLDACVRRVISFKEGDPSIHASQLKEDLIYILNNMSSPKVKSQMVQWQFIDVLMSLIKQSVPNIENEKCIRILCKLCHCKQGRQILMNQPFLNSIKVLLNRGDVQSKQHICLLLSECAKYKDSLSIMVDSSIDSDQSAIEPDNVTDSVTHSIHEILIHDTLFFEECEDTVLKIISHTTKLGNSHILDDVNTKIIRKLSSILNHVYYQRHSTKFRSLNQKLKSETSDDLKFFKVKKPKLRPDNHEYHRYKLKPTEKAEFDRDMSKVENTLHTLSNLCLKLENKQLCLLSEKNDTNDDDNDCEQSTSFISNVIPYCSLFCSLNYPGVSLNCSLLLSLMCSEKEGLKQLIQNDTQTECSKDVCIIEELCEVLSRKIYLDLDPKLCSNIQFILTKSCEIPRTLEVIGGTLWKINHLDIINELIVESIGEQYGSTIAHRYLFNDHLNQNKDFSVNEQRIAVSLMNYISQLNEEGLQQVWKHLDVLKLLINNYHLTQDLHGLECVIYICEQYNEEGPQLLRQYCSLDSVFNEQCKEIPQLKAFLKAPSMGEDDDDHLDFQV